MDAQFEQLYRQLSETHKPTLNKIRKSIIIKLPYVLNTSTFRLYMLPLITGVLPRFRPNV